MQIRVLSLNIEHGGVHWDALIQFLKSEDADVLLLQEVHDAGPAGSEPQFRSMEEFRKLLGYPYDDFAPRFSGEIHGVRITQGNAIFSKFPITQRYEPIFIDGAFNDNYIDIPENYPDCPRNLQHVTLDVQGTALDVFNLHGVWDLDGTNDSPQRLEMSRVIIEATAGLPNVILAGDTNAQRHCKAILNIEQHLTNIFGDELATTFNVKRKDLEKFPGYATAAVDMMFTSLSLKATEHYCPQVDVSDHLPLISRIEIPQ